MEINNLDLACSELEAAEAIAEGDSGNELNPVCRAMYYNILSRYHWETGNRQNSQDCSLAARRWYAEVGWTEGAAPWLIAEQVRFAFEDQDFVSLLGVVQELLSTAQRSQHMWTEARNTRGQ